jgi:YebC/PmpR family DNA-binding regulatory protein
MSGHSKWSKVKHQKTISDAKKGKLFSRLSRLIILAAKHGSDPQTNPTLREAIAKAKEANMPKETIEKAIKRGAGEIGGGRLEKILCEAFGPGGSALIIEAITDNKNRTLAEIKQILSRNKGKLGERGAALWAFEKDSKGEWKTKIPLEISKKDEESLRGLLNSLKENEDVVKLYSNAIVKDSSDL